MKIKYNDSKSAADIILVLILVLFVAVIIGMVGFIIYRINNPKVDDTSNFDPNTITISTDGQRLQTLEEILEKYKVTLIQNTGTKMLVDFPYGFYDDMGRSNSSYYYNMLDEICLLDSYSQRSFTMQDEKKGMEIQAIYEYKNLRHRYEFNGLEDFFSVTDGRSYTEVENAKIIDEHDVSVSTDEGQMMIATNFFYKNIKNYLKEPTGEHGDYMVYKDGAIYARTVNGKVRNIVYTTEYDKPVIYRYKVGTDLETIYQGLKEKVSQGSPRENYLLCRTNDVYVFIYEDEISIWPYTHSIDEPFERYIKEYLEDKDLESFYKKVTNHWGNYLRNDADFEFGEIHLHYPSNGVMIDIRGNEPSGIKIYNNCSFSNYLKNLLQTKVVTFVNDDALIRAEQERRATF